VKKSKQRSPENYETPPAARLDLAQKQTSGLPRGACRGAATPGRAAKHEQAFHQGSRVT